MKKKRSVRRREKRMQEINRLPEGVAFRISGAEAARNSAPYMVPGFRSGAYITQKDRPRDNNWRKWDMD